jgi:hypothetical protein
MASTYRTAGVRLHITENLIEGAPQTLAAHGSPHELVVRDTELKGFIVRLRLSGRHSHGVAYARGKFLTLGGFACSLPTLKGAFVAPAKTLRDEWSSRARWRRKPTWFSQTPRTHSFAHGLTRTD